MAQKVEFELNADERKIVSAWLATSRSIEHHNKTFAAIGGIAQANAGGLSQQSRQQQLVRQALAATVSETERYQQQLTALEAAHAEGKISAEQFANAAGKINEGLDKIKAGEFEQRFQKIAKIIGVATAAITAFSAAQNKYQSEAELAATSIEDLRTKSQVQSGRTDQQQAAANKQIEETAQRRGVDVKQAYLAERQLVSSGFSAEEAAGPALDEFFKSLNASNVTGKDVDPTSLAKSMAGYLESQGMEKSGANVASIGQAIQALFKSSNIQLSGLNSIAKEGAALKTITPQEQFAAFGALVDVGIDEGGAATGLRNIVSRLQTAGGSDKKTAVLEQMGLQATDVDLVGETLTEALAKLKAGIEQLPEEQRAGAAKTLFEEAGAASFLQLADNIPKIEKYIDLQNNPAGFEKDLQLAEGTRSVAATRLENDKTLQAAGSARQDSFYKQALTNEFRERGMSELQIGLRTEGTELPLIGRVPSVYDLFAGLGFSEKTATSLSVGAGTGEYGDVLERVEIATGEKQLPAAPQNTPPAVPPSRPAAAPQADALLERQNQLIEQQNRLLSNIERNTATKPPPSKPNTTPPRPVAGTGRQQGVAAGGPRP